MKNLKATTIIVCIIISLLFSSCINFLLFPNHFSELPPELAQLMTVYVSPTGSDSFGEGTIEKPFRSLQYAILRSFSMIDFGEGEADYPTEKVHRIRLQEGTYSPKAGLNAADCGAKWFGTYNQAGQTLEISGGWDITFSQQSGTTILDGEHTYDHILYFDDHFDYNRMDGLLIDKIEFRNGGNDDAENGSVIYIATDMGSAVPLIYVLLRNCVIDASNSGTPLASEMDYTYFEIQ